MKDFEQIIRDFEKGFFSGRFSQTEDFLKVTNGSAANEDESVLTELLHTELELKIRSGQFASVEEILCRFPELAKNSEFVFDLVSTEYKVRRYCEPGLRPSEFVRRFPSYADRLSRLIDDNEPEDQHDAAEFSDQSSRFRKQRLHDKGGLGNVWLARDLELNRTVAVKEIKDKFSQSESHRYRFARETIITSQLEHPGIVPVYGLGHRTDGTPYFAMQFIDGKTLQAAIEYFHSQIIGTTNGDREIRRLLQRFIDVCHTVQFAHSRGIIHRDLKPANVMLGPYGETYVVDWGLASSANHENPSAKFQSEVSPSFTKFCHLAKSSQSSDGDTIGSPGFMSPEQVSGDLSLLGPASDIFSLGATLWSLISGQKIPDTNDDPFLPAIDFDSCSLSPEYARLKSICKKAAARRPVERYVSAAALAEDIENFLADRQVNSHPDSVQDRVARFTRRNKSAVNTLLTALVLISLVSFGSVIWINHERSTAVAARLSEIKQRKQTELALQQEEQAKNSAIIAQHQAEKRTAQLTKAIGTFANLFSGVDERGVSYELNDVTLQDSIGKLGHRIEAIDEPLVSSFLHSVYAHERIAAGEYSKAADEFATALDWLRKDSIAETDPLYIKTLVLSGFSLYNAQNIPASKRVAELAIRLCDTSTSNVDRDAAQAHLLKATIAHLGGNNDEAFESISRSFEIGTRAFAKETTNPILLRIIQKRAEIFIKKGQIPQAKQTYKKIIDTFVDQGKLHHLVIDSRLRLAELYQFYDYDADATTKILAPIIKESRALWGADHYEALIVEAEYISFQFLNGDKNQQRQSLARLKEIQTMHIESGIKSRAIDATIILGNLLNRQKPEPDHRQIVALIDAVLSHENYTDRQVAADSLWKLYSLRSNSLAILKQVDRAIDSLRETIPIAEQAYGTDSVQYQSTIQKIKYMESGIVDFNGARFNQKLISEYEQKWNKLSNVAEPTDLKLMTLTWQFSKTLENSDKEKDRTRAVKLLEDMIAFFRNHTELDKGQATILVMAYVDLARMYENQSNFDRAVELIDQAIKIGNENEEAESKNSMILLRIQAKLKKRTEAEKKPAPAKEKASNNMLPVP